MCVRVLVFIGRHIYFRFRAVLLFPPTLKSGKKLACVYPGLCLHIRADDQRLWNQGWQHLNDLKCWRSSRQGWDFFKIFQAKSEKRLRTTMPKLDEEILVTVTVTSMQARSIFCNCLEIDQFGQFCFRQKNLRNASSVWFWFKTEVLMSSVIGAICQFVNLRFHQKRFWT